MVNRRKNYMDPKNINEYNKFLSRLDKSSIIRNENENINTNTNTNTNTNEKTGIDLLMDVINSKFIDNKQYLVNFTGLNVNDILKENEIDPNYYRDINVEQFLYKPILFKPVTKSTPVKEDLNINLKQELIVEIKENIHIDTDINSIADILNIIEKYKYDPSIKYNINMKALHAIKEPLIELNNMIGINEIKTNVIDQILYFAQDLHKNIGRDNKNNNVNTCDFMHTVIYGPPGTGKTEISKILGKILSKIGVLSKGTFKKVTRSDLIAGFLGQTAMKTRDVIKESLGGVLFIDEAYALGNSDKKDSFAKECIDTLCESLSDNKENLMVIIAGYEKELKECFFNQNPGLESRFTWRFKINEYSAEDLYNIFLKKVNDIGWKLEENSKIDVDWFKKNRPYFKFNGRDIEAILAKTKIAHSKRVFCKSENEKRKISLVDLEKGLDIYIKSNPDIKNRKQDEETKNYLYNTLYC
jgi:ATP-dependent 26S proteasome regulatory subunit